MKKHRNDVCRLAMLLAGGEHPAMSKGIRADMQRFMEAYESDPVDPKALKIKGVGAQQVVEVAGTSTCSKAVPDCIPPVFSATLGCSGMHRFVCSKGRTGTSSSRAGSPPYRSTAACPRSGLPTTCRR